jgi:hypothetical protein
MEVLVENGLGRIRVVEGNKINKYFSLNLSRRIPQKNCGGFVNVTFWNQFSERHCP